MRKTPVAGHSCRSRLLLLLHDSICDVISADVMGVYIILVPVLIPAYPHLSLPIQASVIQETS
jgi:hypothetical protein